MIRIPEKYSKQDKLVLFRALAMINSHNELDAIKKLFVDEIARLDKANRAEPDETTFRQRQGTLMALENIISNIDAADDNYKKLLQRRLA
jgi:hypothetical protein